MAVHKYKCRLAILPVISGMLIALNHETHCMIQNFSYGVSLAMWSNVLRTIWLTWKFSIPHKYLLHWYSQTCNRDHARDHKEWLFKWKLRVTVSWGGPCILINFNFDQCQINQISVLLCNYCIINLYIMKNCWLLCNLMFTTLQ